MDTTNLAILTLVAASSMFVASIFARRPENENTIFPKLHKVLAAITLALVAVYFYKRFTG